MDRPFYLQQIDEAFRVNSVVALLGPRQCGKTTLAHQYVATAEESVIFFDLENPIHLAKLDAPMLALGSLEGIIVIDEIQRKPDLFPILRLLVDEHTPRKFLILGSASRDLIAQSSETLAGRISYLECTPFLLNEVPKLQKQLMYRGGYPRSLLAEDDLLSLRWREDYVTTFLERDIANLGFRIPAQTMRRFWMMLTHYHGQIFNASELGGSLGIAHTTAKHYLDILAGTFMIRTLNPWFANIKKRQIKSPKIYFRDVGIYLALLQVADLQTLSFHPKLGAAWKDLLWSKLLECIACLPSNVIFGAYINKRNLICCYG